MKKRPAQKHLLHLLALSLVIILAGGGIALLYQWHLGSTASYASGDNVVGPPSLPASYVDAVFRRVGSPMVGTGKVVETASRQSNIDDAFALAVWWTETNDGAAGVGLADRNPGSVRGSTGYPSAYDGYTIYPTYADAVSYWFSMMRRAYIDRGLTTVSAISHPYVGTSTSNLWAGKVITLMQRYRGQAPPIPTPTRAVPPDLRRQGEQLSQDLRQQTSGKKSTYYPPAPAPVQSAPASTGLSSTTQILVVLLGLALALALGLGAWYANKHLARRAQIVPMTFSPWEQMRASGQQPASFFNGFSGPVRTVKNVPSLHNTGSMPSYVPGLRGTDSLVPGLPGSRTTDSLVSNGPSLPTTGTLTTMPAAGAHPEVLTPPDFRAAPARLQALQAPQFAWNGQQMSPFNAPMPVPAGQQAFPPDTFATGQQAFPLAAFAANQSFLPHDSFAIGQPAFPFDAFAAGQSPAPFSAPGQPAFPPDRFATGQLPFPSSTPAPDYAQAAAFSRPGLSGPSRLPQNSLHPTFQPAGAENANRQPQPVGTGAGGGLLSRYRAQNRQE